MPNSQDQNGRKILRLNYWQLVFIVIVPLVTGGVAWAKGWLNLPEKVTSLEATADMCRTLPPRVEHLESQAKELQIKRSDDHDLLLGIRQSLLDVKQQTDETRADIKELRGHVVNVK